MDDTRATPSDPDKARGIMVIDDDLQVLKFVSRMLASLGYQNVFQAASATEAHEIWKRQHGRIKLVISDFVMPEQTGDSIALAMRQQDSSLQILLISGNDPANLDSLIPLQPGVNFLQKPFTVAEMRQSISSLAQCS